MTNEIRELILELIQKFYTKEKYHINLEEGTQISKMRQAFDEDPKHFEFFSDELRKKYEQKDFPKRSKIDFLFHDIGTFGSEKLVNAVKKLILEFLEDPNPNLKRFGVQIYRHVKFDRKKDVKIILTIISFLDSANSTLIAESFWTLERFTLICQDFYSKHIATIISLILDNEDPKVISQGMGFLGKLYLELARKSPPSQVDDRIINAFLKRYEIIEDDDLKMQFLDGLAFLMLKYPRIYEEWVDFLTKEYYDTKNLALKSTVLMDLYFFPSNKRLDENCLLKYKKFFETELNQILKKTYEIPKQTTAEIVPNLPRDILSSVQQLSFEIPLVVEGLLPLYEQAVEKYFQGLPVAKETYLHTPYLKIAMHYLNELKIEKSIMYSQKLVGVEGESKVQVAPQISKLLPLAKKKLVIVLGKDTGKVLNMLQDICKYLNTKNYEACLVKDIPEVPAMSNEDKVRHWMSTAKFCVMLDKELSGYISEFEYAKQQGIILALVREKGKRTTWMIHEDGTKWNFIKEFQFEEDPIKVLDEIITWAEGQAKSREIYYSGLYKWRKSNG